MKILTILLLSLVATGCVTPKTRSVLSVTQNPKVTQRFFTSPRSCSIRVAPLTDYRKAYETTSTNQAEFRYFFPLLLWNQFSSAGPVYGEQQYYDKNLLVNLNHLITNVLQRSHVCSGTGTSYVVKPQLMHYYGVNYKKMWMFFAAGGGFFEKYSFYPAGHVAIKISMVEQSTGRVVATKYLSENYLFNPTGDDLYVQTTPFGPGLSIINAKSQVPLIALSRLMYRLPYEIDRMLANEPNMGVPENSTPKRFLLVRLTREYDFQEILIVDYATGKIVKNLIIRRSFPIISKPNEWVVAPVSMTTYHWMGSTEYLAFVKTLRERYKVSFSRNLDAANYYGVKSVPQPLPKNESVTSKEASLSLNKQEKK